MWSPAERLRAVLLHELSHLRHRDPLCNFIGQFARTVHWFNPLAWLALAQLRIEQERTCDDDALCGGIVASAYAGHLLALANRCQPAASVAAFALAAAAVAAGRPREVDSRSASKPAIVADVGRDHCVVGNSLHVGGSRFARTNRKASLAGGQEIRGRQQIFRGSSSGGTGRTRRDGPNCDGH